MNYGATSSVSLGECDDPTSHHPASSHPLTQGTTKNTQMGNFQIFPSSMQGRLYCLCCHKEMRFFFEPSRNLPRCSVRMPCTLVGEWCGELRPIGAVSCGPLLLSKSSTTECMRHVWCILSMWCVGLEAPPRSCHLRLQSLLARSSTAALALSAALPPR